MKTIIAGSRNIIDYHLVDKAVKESKFNITEIVSGGAKGVDSLGEKYGYLNGISIKVFPADWESYGRKAGIMRNQEMSCYAEALILVWDGNSPGSANMLSEAKKRNLKIHILQVDMSSKTIPWDGN